MNKLDSALQLLDVQAEVFKAVARARAVLPTPAMDAALSDAGILLNYRLARVNWIFRPPAPLARPAKRQIKFEEASEQEDPPISEMEVGGCKALLLEIIRRASYDWVLYRTSKVLPKRRMAEDAFNWLFKEGPGQLEWLERVEAKKEITSFMAICESLDLGVEKVRNHIRRLTVKNVMSIGRPAEYRRQEQWQDSDDSYPTSMGDRALHEVVGYDDMSSFEDVGGGSEF